MSKILTFMKQQIEELTAAEPVLQAVILKDLHAAKELLAGYDFIKQLDQTKQQMSDQVYEIKHPTREQRVEFDMADPQHVKEFLKTTEGSSLSDGAVITDQNKSAAVSTADKPDKSDKPAKPSKPSTKRRKPAVKARRRAVKK